MKKEVLIFGAYGALGKGVSKQLLNKDYDKIYCFDFETKEFLKDEKVENIFYSGLNSEDDIVKVFSKINFNEETEYFLYSTIGGYVGGKNLLHTSIEDFEKMFKMNFFVNVIITKEFIKRISQSSGGSICLTAAMTGLIPSEGASAYGASKSALIHFVKTISKEFLELKISVNAIAPLIIDTPANREWMNEKQISSAQKPEEIGEIVHSIFSNYKNLNGNIFELGARF